TFMTAALVASISLLWSSLFRRTLGATVVSYLSVFALLAGTAVVAVIATVIEAVGVATRTVTTVNGVTTSSSGTQPVIPWEWALRTWPVDSPLPILAWAAAAGLAAGAAGWAFTRPDLGAVARLADLRLGGSERLATAFELAAEGGYLVERQRGDALRWTAGVRPGSVAGAGIPRRELVAATVLTAAALALLMLPNPA